MLPYVSELSELRGMMARPKRLELQIQHVIFIRYLCAAWRNSQTRWLDKALK
jgi:hypothetical protein